MHKKNLSPFTSEHLSGSVNHDTPDICIISNAELQTRNDRDPTGKHNQIHTCTEHPATNNDNIEPGDVSFATRNTGDRQHMQGKPG